MLRFPLTLLAACVLTSCTVRPFLKSGESVVSLGGSVFTRSTGETATYSGPLGTLSYADTGKDETVVPAKMINSYTTIGLAKEVTKAFDTSEATKVKLGEQSVSKHATSTAADVEKVKILNPVEEIPIVP